MSSWLSRQMGTNSLSQDFNYDPQMIDFQAPPMSSLGLAAQQNTASMMMGNASRMSGQANQMMDMNSGFYGQMQNNLQQQIGDATTSATSQANRQLSMTGGGGGSLRNLLGTANASRVGEQVQQGVIGMYGQGQQNAAAMMGQASGAMQGAGGLQAQAAQTRGQFISAMESNRLQAGMANQAAYNEQQQYERTSSYNQVAGNRAARGEFMGNLMSMYGTIAAGAAEGASDIKLKKNIKKVGKSNNGINIYEFDYKDKKYGEGRYRGVMAQEVPWASVRTNEYLGVDYSKIDVNFERIS